MIFLRHVRDGRPITYAWSKLESLKRSFRGSVFHARLKLKTLQHDLKHIRNKQMWQNVGELDLCDTVLRCTYVCAPGKRNFDHRRQLCRSYHFSESCLEYFARTIVVEICWTQNLGVPLDIFWLSTFFRSHSPVSYRRSSCQKRKSIGGPTARRHWQFYSECCSQSPGRMHRNPVGRWQWLDCSLCLIAHHCRPMSPCYPDICATGGAKWSHRSGNDTCCCNLELSISSHSDGKLWMFMLGNWKG